jgi:UV DNA damage endonuclease
LQRIGEKVYLHDVRLTYHPGPFNVLATQRPEVLKKTIKELRQHAEIMDLMGLPRTPYSKINIHLGGAYGDKFAAMERFIKNVSLLPINARSRLTIENDDRASLFSVKDLVEVHKATRLPVVFDYLHHQFCTGGLSEQEALLTAYSTWPEGIRPIVHYSSSKKRFEDPQSTEASHAEYVYENVNTYGMEVDVMLEAKAKEKATLQYLQQFHVNQQL